MIRAFWKRPEVIENTVPPVLLGVPGMMLGIAVPFLPQPGRLHIISPYACDAHVDHVALRGMRWACRIDEAA